MLARLRRRKRLRVPFPVLCSLLLIIIFVSALYQFHGSGDTKRNQDSIWQPPGPADLAIDHYLPQQDSYSKHLDRPDSKFEDHREQREPIAEVVEHREIFSRSSKYRAYYAIIYEDVYGVSVISPSIIPHPTESDKWIVTARDAGYPHKQMVCTAKFDMGIFTCVDGFATLPRPASLRTACTEDMALMRSPPGPHNEVRAFYGPDVPYILYGSHGLRGCPGAWIQDALSVLNPFHFKQFTGPRWFQGPTEVREPDQPDPTEKDLFVFWDSRGQMFVHYQLWPQREFAQLQADGTVGSNLARLTKTSDQMCYGKHMPYIQPGAGSLQQASNSLSVTLCERKDPRCAPSAANTFIMHVFHIRYEYEGDLVYEPYVVLFQRDAPFAVHAISQRPLWVYGRETVSLEGETAEYQRPGRLNVTNIVWKAHTSTYHGYINDMMFLSFSVEDEEAGLIDVQAGDLLQDLAFC